MQACGARRNRRLGSDGHRVPLDRDFAWSGEGGHLGTRAGADLQLEPRLAMIEVDLDQTAIRELNERLHRLPADTNERAWHIVNPKGRHAIAVGLDQSISLTIDGHVGFYCAGMNKQAEVTVNGHAGPGVAENMMSGSVRVRGNASQSAGASARGGLLVVEGDTSSRCGISMKGADIVVGGSVGHMSAFMAQRGNLVVCGDAGRSPG